MFGQTQLAWWKIETLIAPDTRSEKAAFVLIEKAIFAIFWPRAKFTKLQLRLLDYPLDKFFKEMNMQELVQSFDDFQLLRTLVELHSAGCGWGVYAKTDFAPCDFIGQVDGVVIQGDDYCSEYCMELDEQHSIEPFAPFRYLNHSCMPNCQLTSDEYGDPQNRFQPLIIQAISEISPGDELTIDYGWPADMAMKCLCGSVNCRGWIVDESETDRIPSPGSAI